MKKKMFITMLLMSMVSALYAQSGKLCALKDFPQNKVMVVAHRGNWRDAPENSVWAVKKAIEAGANMAEVDLKITKDSALVLMHDKTIDRTTTGKGKVSDFTLAELKTLYLRDGVGHPTQMRIPTLEEILMAAKGKIYLNLDQGFEYIGLVYPLLKKYNMLDDVLFKGASDYATFNEKYGYLKNEIVFMPIVRLEKLGKEKAQEMIDGYLKNYKPFGFEFTVGTTEDNLIDFTPLHARKINVWVNALWLDQNAGHNDDVALQNPNVYEWFLKKKVNIIQTDRIKLLSDFLRKRGLKQ